VRLTDFNAVTLVDGNTRVGGACEKMKKNMVSRMDLTRLGSMSKDMNGEGGIAYQDQYQLRLRIFLPS